MTGSPAGPSGGTRSRGRASPERDTATFNPGTAIVALLMTVGAPGLRV